MQAVSFHFFGDFSALLLDNLAEKILVFLQPFEFESFLVGCSFPYSLSEDEKMLLKKEFQFALVQRLVKKTGKKFAAVSPTIQILVDFNARKLFFFIQPVFLEGRYNKFSREIAQTIFYCPTCQGRGCHDCNGKGKRGLETIEELVGKPAKELFQANDFSFHGAGREDVNVRMLGNGREFVLELIQPKKRFADLKQLEETINQTAQGKIVVHDLKIAAKNRIVELKAQRFFKKYGCLVSCRNPISVPELKKWGGKDFLVEQRTPHRVKARRADLVRKRFVQLLSVKALSSTEFECLLLAEAGLYVKEFISSDNERTAPSFSLLLQNSCVCKQLDVLEILSSNQIQKQKTAD